MDDAFSMAVTLRSVNDATLVLEFEPDEIDRVRDTLRETYGVPEISRYPLFTVYIFEKASLTFHNNWDAPCLIASDEAGHAMLREVSRLIALPIISQE